MWYFLVFFLGFTLGFLGKLLVLKRTWLFWYQCAKWAIKTGRMPTHEEMEMLYSEVFEL